MELRSYQTELIEKIKKEFQLRKKRVCAYSPTGSGKGFVIAKITEKALANHKKVIIVLPRRSLVHQLSSVFVSNNIDHGILMSGNSRMIHSRCLIASIDSYTAWLRSKKIDIIHADLLIVDELHMQFTAKKLEIFEHYKHVLSFSATPIAPKKQALNVFYDSLVVGIGVKELQDMGYLAKLKYYSYPGIELDDIKKDATGDYKRSQIDERMDKPKLIGDIVTNWLRIAKGIPSVVFCTSQSHAAHLKDQFQAVGYTFEYLDCNTPDEERQEIFRKIKTGESTGIVNYSIVGVGVDIPNLKCCVLARPTRLITNYHQYVGRITRPTEDGSHGIVIDHAGIIERLGFIEDDIEWTLDGKEFTQEELQRMKEEREEPKQITCKECGTVYKSRRDCPECGYQSVKQSEPIPTHKAELVEIEQPKFKSYEKQQFFCELLGYQKKHRLSNKYALAVYKSRFNQWPYGKNSAYPLEPSQETLNWIKHNNIRYAKSKR